MLTGAPNSKLQTNEQHMPAANVDLKFAQGLCISLSEDALFEVLTGQIDRQWLKLDANAICIADHKYIDDLGGSQ